MTSARNVPGVGANPFEDESSKGSGETLDEADGLIEVVEVGGQIDAKAIATPPRPPELPPVVVAGRSRQDDTACVSPLPDPSAPAKRWLWLRPFRSG